MAPRKPTRAELIDVYKIAVEEYRFQVNLNWTRAQFLLTFNTAIIGVGTGLVKLSGNSAKPLIIGVFGVGALSALLSSAAMYVQKGYYKSSAKHMEEVADRLALGDVKLRTTPEVRGEIRRRLGKVTSVLHLLLGACFVVNILGIVYTANLTTPTPARPTPLTVILK